jgi:hypothetical protein
MPKDDFKTAALASGLLAGTVLFGLLVRLRVLVVSPLPSAQPVRWLLLGAAGDLAVMGSAAVIALLLARSSRLARPARGFLVAAFALSGLAVFLFSELLAYFGAPPRRGDLSPASLARFVTASFDTAAFVRLAGVAVALAALAALALRRAGKARASRVTPRRLLVGVLACLVLAALPVPVHLGRSAMHPLLALVDGVRKQALPADEARLPGFRALGLRGVEPPPDRVRRPAATRSADAPRFPAGLKPNVVFLLLEGVRSRELGAWGGLPGLSPNIDALARGGIRVDRAYSPGTHTPEGELGLWYGLRATPEALVMTDRPEFPRHGLPEILRAAGWRSFLWIHNGDQTFYRRDRFYPPRGFRVIDGRDFPPSDPRTNWGYSDRSLMARSLTALDALEEPFAAMILTVSNHHPFQVPDDATTTFDPPTASRAGFVKVPGLPQLLGLHTGGMLKTIHYTDEAVGAFFAGARLRPWFPRTLFVVAGDHGLPIAPLSGTPSAHEFDELRHRVPLLLVSSLLPSSGPVPGPVSLYDVPPTLLGLLGLPVPPEMSGRDFLDPRAAADDEPVIAWNDDGRTVTAATRRFVWNATVEEGPPLRFTDEGLFAPGDVNGSADLSEREPAAAETFRRAVRAWLADRLPAREIREAPRD